MKTQFRRYSVDFEAVQFTGDNISELRELTGTRISSSTGDDIWIFNPIGTYIPAHLYDKENPKPTAELWVDDSHQWRPVYVGEWIVQQDEGWLSVTDEWIATNCIRLDEDMLALIQEDERPKTFEEELVTLLNKHSMENPSGTPDYILAEYLMGCMRTYDMVIGMRANWRGERIDSIFNVKYDKKLPLSMYDEHGRRNDIGEVEVEVWPGEVIRHGRIVGVTPIFAASAKPMSIENEAAADESEVDNAGS